MARPSLSWPRMERLLQDVRYALRTLARTPAWTAMAALTLALGTGANAAVFSFVDALLFKPAPGVHPAGPLVSVFSSDFSSGPYGETSYDDYLSIASETQAFAALAAIDDAIVAPLRVGDDGFTGTRSGAWPHCPAYWMSPGRGRCRSRSGHGAAFDPKATPRVPAKISS